MLSCSKDEKSSEKYVGAKELLDVLTLFGPMMMDEDQEYNSHKFAKIVQLESKKVKKRMQDEIKKKVRSGLPFIGRC